MAELTPHNQPSGIRPDHLLVASIAAVLSVAIHVGLAVMATYVNVNMFSGSVMELHSVTTTSVALVVPISQQDLHQQDLSQQDDTVLIAQQDDINHNDLY
jgi:hypothetical protein